MDRTQSKYALTTQKLIIKRKIVGIAFFFLKMGKSISPAQMAVIRLASHNGQAHSTKQCLFDRKTTSYIQFLNTHQQHMIILGRFSPS